MSESDALKFLRSPWYWVEMKDSQREALRLACRGIPMNKRLRVMGTDRRTFYFHLTNAITKVNEAEDFNITTRILTLAFLNKLEIILKG